MNNKKQDQIVLSIHHQLDRLPYSPTPETVKKIMVDNHDDLAWLFKHSSPSLWFVKDDYEYFPLLKTPSHTVNLVDWSGETDAHFHHNTAGGHCDAFVYCINGKGFHERYTVAERRNNDIFLSLAEKTLLLPGQLLHVPRGQAHKMGAASGHLWTVHYYNGVLADRDRQLNLIIR